RELAATFGCVIILLAAPLAAQAQIPSFGDGFVRLAKGGAPPPPPPPPACTPTTCAAQGKNCGTISNGCGGTLTCGACTAPQTCGGGGVANVCGTCTPTTCAAQGKNCGAISDGCGGTLTCGACTTPQTCGGAGVANVCGAAPTTATLTVTATGRAGVSVVSTPARVNVPVGTTGSASFPVGTSITLSATNARSAIWSGVCSRAGPRTLTCTVNL